MFQGVHNRLGWSVGLFLFAVGSGVPLAPRDARAIPVSGTIRYLGTLGVVSSNEPMQLVIGTQPDDLGKLGRAAVTTDGGSFDFDVPTAGDYFLAYFLDIVADGAPSVGEPYQIFDHETSLAHADPLHVPDSGVTGLILDFDDSGVFVGVAGTASYRGSLGQVSQQTPIVVEAFTDECLVGGASEQTRVIVSGGRFDIIRLDVPTATLYLRAFLDLNGDSMLGPCEPFSIFQNKSSCPGDGVTPQSTTAAAIDVSFGDENLSPCVTPTPAPTPTPTLGACAGDCEGTGVVTVADLVTLANVALGNAQPSACPSGIPPGVEVNVGLIIAAINHALSSCF